MVAKLNAVYKSLSSGVICLGQAVVTGKHKNTFMSKAGAASNLDQNPGQLRVLSSVIAERRSYKVAHTAKWHELLMVERASQIGCST